MFRCDNCGAMFETPKVYTKWGYSTSDELPPIWDGCPYCASEDILRIRQCIFCGEWSAKGYIIKDRNDFICKNCVEEINENDV